MPMCLLNMNDAQSGVQGLTLAASSDSHCQARPAPTPHHLQRPSPSPTALHPSTPTTGMVVNLLQHHGGDQILEGQRVPCACPGVHSLPPQFALLPVRLTPNIRPAPTIAPSDTPAAAVMIGHGACTMPLLAVTNSAVVGSSTHCPCCPFNSYQQQQQAQRHEQQQQSHCLNQQHHHAHYDSGFSEQHFPHGYQQQQQQYQQVPHRYPQPTGQCHHYYNSSNLLGGSGGQVSNVSKDYGTHTCIGTRHSEPPTTHCHCPTTPISTTRSSSTQGSSDIYENSLFHNQLSGKLSIPRIVCHSPAPGEVAIKSVDSGISSPTLSDSSLCSKPDLQHSKSLQEEDLSHHHQRWQMAGGHLSIQPPHSTSSCPSSTSAHRHHRHSTGSVLENVQNELNSIANNNANIPTNHKDLTSTTIGSKGPFSVEPSPFLTGEVFGMGTFGGAPTQRADNNKTQSDIFSTFQRPNTTTTGTNATTSSNSDESSSAKTAMTGWSLGSNLDWEGSDPDISGGGGGCRSSSPSGSSGDSSGDCSGCSVASWAQQFTGATENAQDWKTLKVSTKKLSKCGFYYEHMSMEQAKLRLKGLPVGSFLLRDSSNKHYLFSLSAKTPRGVTSVRIEYRNALFRLDGEEKSRSQMPGFDCVLKLVQHYVQLSENKRSKKCMWLETSGRKDTPVLLTRPATQGVPSLTHMCRKVIHKTIPMEKLAQNLKTDFTLLQYLREYPYYV